MRLSDIKTLLYECELILLGKKKFKLFGIISYGLTKRILQENQKGFPKDNMPSIYTKLSENGKQLVIVHRNDITRGHIIYGILHQIIHIICGHLNRKGEKDETVWNLACDHVVNRVIKELAYENIQFDIPEDAVYFLDIELMYPESAAERIYDELMKDAQKGQNNQINQPQVESESNGGSQDAGKSPESPSGPAVDGNGEDGKSKDGTKEAKDNQQNQQQNSTTGSQNKRLCISSSPCIGDIQYITVKDNKSGNSFNLINDTNFSNTDNFDSEKVDNAIDKMSNQIKTLWHSNQIEKGELPGNFCNMLDHIYKIEIPWHQLLESALLYPVQHSKRRSWMEPNFYVRKPIRIPGKCQKSKRPKIFLGCIDTSGSIRIDDLKVFTGVLMASVDHYNGLIVLQHDVILQREIRYDKKPDMHTLYESILRVDGGGGTSHSAVFSRIQQLLDDDSAEISSFVFLTDYYSDVEEIYKQYDWIKKHETIWVLTGTKVNNVELDGCKTSTIRISTLGDTKKTTRY